MIHHAGNDPPKFIHADEFRYGDPALDEFFTHKSGWYFFDEAELPVGPYDDEDSAKRGQQEFLKSLDAIRTGAYGDLSGGST